jgi:hypothetical protein
MHVCGVHAWTSRWAWLSYVHIRFFTSLLHFYRIYSINMLLLQCVCTAARIQGPRWAFDVCKTRRWLRVSTFVKRPVLNACIRALVRHETRACVLVSAAQNACIRAWRTCFWSFMRVEPWPSSMSCLSAYRTQASCVLLLTLSVPHTLLQGKTFLDRLLLTSLEVMNL